MLWRGLTLLQIDNRYIRQLRPARLTEIKDPSVPNFLSIAVRRIVGFIPFQRTLVCSEFDLESPWSFFMVITIT